MSLSFFVNEQSFLDPTTSGESISIPSRNCMIVSVDHTVRNGAFFATLPKVPLAMGIHEIQEVEKFLQPETLIPSFQKTVEPFQKAIKA